MQRSASRRNHLKAMKENLALLKLVEIMRQIIQNILSKKAEEQEQDIHLQSESTNKTTMFCPLKVFKEIIVIESDDE